MRNLVTLGKVGIEIVFAGEARVVVNGAIQGERGADAHFNGTLVEHGKRAGKAEANGADIGVGSIAETRRAAAENLGFGQQLGMDFRNPITGSYLARSSGVTLDSVANFVIS